MLEENGEVVFDDISQDDGGPNKSRRHSADFTERMKQDATLVVLRVVPVPESWYSGMIRVAAEPDRDVGGGHSVEVPVIVPPPLKTERQALFTDEQKRGLTLPPLLA